MRSRRGALQLRKIEGSKGGGSRYARTVLGRGRLVEAAIGLEQLMKPNKNNKAALRGGKRGWAEGASNRGENAEEGTGKLLVKATSPIIRVGGGVREKT